MKQYSPEIEEAFNCLPVLRGYHDIWGNYFSPTEEAVRGVLRSLRFDTTSETILRDQLLTWKNRRSAKVVVLHGNENSIRLADDSDDRRIWHVLTENGDQFVGRVQGEQVILPNGISPGYHKLTLKNSEWQLIVCPEKAYLPPGQGKRWGLSVQLYSAHSKESEGIGDFSNLLSLSRYTSRLGGSFVGINPLHLLFPNERLGYSPYSPSSRRALNPLYIRLSEIPEFSPEDTRLSDSLRNTRQALIDYRAVSKIKLTILKRCFDRLEGRRLEEFKHFKKSCDPHLVHGALHSALDVHFRTVDPELWGWSVWPECRTLEQAAKSSIIKDEILEVDFHLFCQWEADRQLRNSRGELELGLYLDLSVGVSPNGAEVWEDQTLFALGASSGAPPDLLNVQGQVWGLAPYIPWELESRLYKPFIETLRFQMQYAGALRIDHIMALQRLYWVPDGFTGRDGMYISYPLRDLIGIVALESERNRCVVIGEDLGTVPDEIRSEMKSRDILSYKVLYFMKNYDTDGSFKPVNHYSENSLVTESTHDLPTLKGFLTRRDLEIRRELNLFTETITYEGEYDGRSRDISNLLTLLGLSSDSSTWNEILEKVMLALGSSPSSLQGIQIEDLLGVADQMNLPGTVDEYPNWKQRLPLLLDEILLDPHLESLLGRITVERRG